MDLGFLDLKNFDILFPNKNITDISYKENINKYIESKLNDIINIKSLSGTDLINEKKKYLNTYLIPIMTMLFSKYYIKYNQLNTLINKNNSILNDFNSLPLFYNYNNPIIKNVNIYFHKKYVKSNNKNNKSLVNVNEMEMLTIMKASKEKIVNGLNNYIKVLNYDYEKLNLYITLEENITNLKEKYDKIVGNINFINNYKNTIDPTNEIEILGKSNKFIDNINDVLNKLFYYISVAKNPEKTKQDIEEMLNILVELYIKDLIKNEIRLNNSSKTNANRKEKKGEKSNTINIIKEIVDIYKKQINLYENNNIKNNSNNNIKNIKKTKLINSSKTYYKNINNKINFTITNRNINNNFTEILYEFINYDNYLTGKFLNIDDVIDIDIDPLKKLKTYKEELKTISTNNDEIDEIINEEKLKKNIDLKKNDFTENSTISKTAKNNFESSQVSLIDKQNKINEIKTKIEGIDEIINSINDIKFKNSEAEQKINAITNISESIKKELDILKTITPLKEFDEKKNYIIKIFEKETNKSKLETEKATLEKDLTKNKSQIRKKENDYKKYLKNIFIVNIKKKLDLNTNKDYKKNVKNTKVIIKKNKIELLTNFLEIDKKLKEKIDIINKNKSTNRLEFFLENDTKFTKFTKFETIDLNTNKKIKELDKNIASYVMSFNKKDEKKNLFINQLKNDTKNISNNPGVSQFLDTIYAKNDKIIEDLKKQINNSLRNPESNKKNIIDRQKNLLQEKIKNLAEKIKNLNTGNKKNKNIIDIIPYTDVIQLYFSKLLLIQLLFTNYL